MRNFIWWGLIAFSFGTVLEQGCGGRILVAECKSGMQFCREAVVCCPSFTTCGTGNNGCKLGDCCATGPDAGDEPSPYWEDPTQNYDANYGGLPPSNEQPGGAQQGSHGLIRQM